MITQRTPPAFPTSIDDPTAAALLTSHIDDVSPSLERLQELFEEKLEARGLRHWAKVGPR
jgi:hypothetical protein